VQVFHFVKDLDASSGGPSRSVPALAENQSLISNTQVSIIFGASANPYRPGSGTRVRYLPIEDLSSVHEFTHHADSGCLFHIHGLWSPLLHRAAKTAVKRRIPYVVSSRGMMAAWAMQHKALKKRMAWWLYQKTDLTRADRIIVSSRFEQDDVMKWLPNSVCDILPNGCEKIPVKIHSDAHLLDKDGSRWALAMGRLHPVKGYEDLIRVWAEVRPAGWKLAIAGPDEGGYLKNLQSLIATKNLNEQITFLGPVDDQQKWNLLDQCELFLAPSRTENFGMAIAEALQSGTPVITTTGTPWEMLPDRRCGWWVELTDQGLKNALVEATRMNSDSLRMMGHRGQKLVLESFSWESVAARSLEIYQSVMEKRQIGIQSGAD